MGIEVDATHKLLVLSGEYFIISNVLKLSSQTQKLPRILEEFAFAILFLKNQLHYQTKH